MNPVKAALLWASENDTLRTRLPRYRFVRATPSIDSCRARTPRTRSRLPGASRKGPGIPASFTRLGENTTDLAQAAEAAGDYLRLLDRIEELQLDAEISLKLTQLGFDLDPQITATHLGRLVDRSAELGRTCWIDIESTRYVDGTLDLYESELGRSPHVGLCLQAYLRRTYDDVKRLLPLEPSIRLVKGAYREPAQLVFSSKSAIDESYLRLAGHLVHGGARRVVLGSHDTELIARIERPLGGHEDFEIAMLYGIRSDEQRRYARGGYSMRTLISYGAVRGTRGSCAASPRSPSRTRCSPCGT